MPNLDRHSPSIRGGVAYDADLSPRTLNAIDVLAPGTLVVDDIEGNRAIYTFAAPTGTTAYSNFPHRVSLQIAKVVGNGSGAVGNGTTGTNLTFAQLVCLH